MDRRFVGTTLTDTTMDDHQIYRLIGNLEGGMASIEKLLAEGNEQRREFQTELRLAVSEIQAMMPTVAANNKWIDDKGNSMVPKVEAHHEWIEGDGKKTARRVEQAGYFLAGSAVVGTSPAWFTKLIAIFQGILP